MILNAQNINIGDLAMIWKRLKIDDIIEQGDLVFQKGIGPWIPLSRKWFGLRYTSNMFPIGRWIEDPYVLHRKKLEALGIEKENE